VPELRRQGYFGTGIAGHVFSIPGSLLEDDVVRAIESNVAMQVIVLLAKTTAWLFGALAFVTGVSGLS
jgi:hypothetical protein